MMQLASWLHALLNHSYAQWQPQLVHIANRNASDTAQSIRSIICGNACVHMYPDSVSQIAITNFIIYA